MTVGSIQLTREQLVCLVPVKGRSRYAMDCVHVMPDGNTESTDGKALLRVRGTHEAASGVSWLFPASVARTAARIMKRGSTVTLEQTADGKQHLHCTDKDGNSITIEAPRSENEYPPTDRVMTQWADAVASGSTYMNVDVLLRTVKALRAAGADTLRVEFLGEGVRPLRLTATRAQGRPFSGLRVCGVIMPALPLKTS